MPIKKHIQFRCRDHSNEIAAATIVANRQRSKDSVGSRPQLSAATTIVVQKLKRVPLALKGHITSLRDEQSWGYRTSG